VLVNGGSGNLTALLAGAPAPAPAGDVLAGRYDVFIDARFIRTHGPGDHFGELAARDWGGGYGYTRLATIRCTEPGRLLRLTSQDLQWLVDTQPTVKARLAATLAERLQTR
jgi:CRP-like cAMP-binding protein